MTFAHASNAIAGFFIDQFTFDHSPWDQFLAGNDDALTQRQLAGAQTFLTLKCSICHNGSTFSDEQFHDVAVAQIGPGEGNGPSLRDDFGRMNVTGDAADHYRFRTTPLRNVELTAPTATTARSSRFATSSSTTASRTSSSSRFDPMQLEHDLQWHAPPDGRGDPRATRPAARRRRAHRRTRRQADGLHERAHRRRGARSLEVGADARTQQASD